jgi:hypothetical protein
MMKRGLFIILVIAIIILVFFIVLYLSISLNKNNNTRIVEEEAQQLSEILHSSSEFDLDLFKNRIKVYSNLFDKKFLIHNMNDAEISRILNGYSDVQNINNIDDLRKYNINFRFAYLYGFAYMESRLNRLFIISIIISALISIVLILVRLIWTNRKRTI